MTQNFKELFKFLPNTIPILMKKNQTDLEDKEICVLCSTGTLEID
jgi:hypothetical protein